MPTSRHNSSAKHRIVVAGAGAVGASVAYHLALRGARDVVLADRGTVAGGATGKAMGGVRQQFSTPAEVRLVQASIRLFQELGAPLFEQVGYLFLATTDEGLAELEQRRTVQRELGVPVERVDPAFVDGLAVDDVRGAVICREDGIADPAAVTRELVGRAAERGVEVREGVDASALAADVLVVACGAGSPAVAASRGVELPIRPLCRQLVDVGPVSGLPPDLPMTIEVETGFHFRRMGHDVLRLAMVEPVARWGDREWVDEALVEDWRERLGWRYPRARGTPVLRAWAGLYDMTPDAHPIIGAVGEGLYVAAGFSGHGFMQAPAVGAAVAEEILTGASSFDLSAYRLERFAGAATFPETVVL
jgi:glycine/D-amino acid oxidase-like deaminating enzyme